MQRFPSLGLKSRITARWRSFPSETLQRFPNSPPQIKNHCRTEGVSRQNPAAIPKSGLEIWNRCSRWEVAFCRRNHFSLRQRKLVSDAEYRCRHGRSRRNHFLSRQRRLESDADLVAATTVADETILLDATMVCKRLRCSYSGFLHQNWQS